jgi:hypothetical protein
VKSRFLLLVFAFLMTAACSIVETPTPTMTPTLTATPPPTRTPSPTPTATPEESTNDELDEMIANADRTLSALEGLINLMSADVGRVFEGTETGFEIQIEGAVTASFPPAQAQWSPVYALINVPLEYTQLTFFSEEANFSLTLVLPVDITPGTYALETRFGLSDQPAARGESFAANLGIVYYDTDTIGNVTIERMDEQSISGRFEFSADASGKNATGTPIPPQSISVTGTFEDIPFVTP